MQFSTETKMVQKSVVFPLSAVIKSLFSFQKTKPMELLVFYSKTFILVFKSH